MALSPVANLLASGMDKVRNDACLIVWDFSQRTNGTDIRPLFSTATAETISSVAFLSDQPQTLAVGANFKWLRVYDLRQSPSMPTVTCPTKSVHGLCSDPYDANYIASFADEGTVSLWDRRYIKQWHSGEAALSVSRPHQSSRATSLRQLRYSHVARGEFSVLDTSGQIHVWQIASLGQRPQGITGFAAGSSSKLEKMTRQVVQVNRSFDGRRK